MAEICKFSLAYDAAEDRLAWDAEDLEGGVTRLWLTQRLCRGMIEALIPRLPKPQAELAPEHEQAVQSWEQAAAMSEFGKTPGVLVQPESAAGLVRTVHLRPTAEAVTFVFEFGVGEERSITLAAPAIRQMLSVMHSLHAAAGWPTGAFPAWVFEPASAEAAPALN